MVTIHNLEVRFEVEGGEEEAAFVRFFEKYIKQWVSKQEAARNRERLSARERSMGDRAVEEHEV